MARWESGARERLERAALELFTEQGFTETTVPQITARAGLTTRTFFRHFADKREVLFAGEDAVAELIATTFADAPPDLGPMALVAADLPDLAETLFGGQREQLRTRNAVVAQDEGLRERDLRKRATLTEQLRAGFVARGADELTAGLAAALTVTAMSTSVGRWLAGDERPLRAIVAETLAALRAVATTLPVG